MTENTETSAETPEVHVSVQKALRTWSVIARDLHEGASILLLHKAWDSNDDEIVMIPTYAEQDPDAIKPDVWMGWRHELKAPLAGHSRIRNYARVVASLPIGSPDALAAIDGEHGLTRVEAVRRFHVGEPGLVALVVRTYRLARTYKFPAVAENEGDGLFASLPFDVDFADATAVVENDAFERRHAAVKGALAPS